MTYGPNKSAPFPMDRTHHSHRKPCGRCGRTISVNTTRDRAKPGFGICEDCKDSDPHYLEAIVTGQALVPRAGEPFLVDGYTVTRRLA